MDKAKPDEHLSQSPKNLIGWSRLVGDKPLRDKKAKQFTFS
jgi:hypothetical protein